MSIGRSFIRGTSAPKDPLFRSRPLIQRLLAQWHPSVSEINRACKSDRRIWISFAVIEFLAYFQTLMWHCSDG
ncbi:hypothetical protein TNIN_252841 [Trichonephila inaurata madagascariensis]|uniref:Uncharacterized protein n=1 Tax=Trichonephila inaurata madagascariensis TaxID=2747483 RepID=A0A8X7C9A8_9ARAC|nr:hypothetical protein TNIN_252841 [Trichonephila inaurata madagascariensis]